MNTVADIELMKALAGLPKRLTREEAAHFLGVSVRSLEEWHRKGLPPKAVKHGQRGVRYLKPDLEDLLNQWSAASN